MDSSVIVLFFLVSSVSSTEVMFEATPAELTKNLTDVANMRCSVGGSAAPSNGTDLHRVMSLFVTRANGADVASVTGTDAPVGFVEPGNLQVSGGISGLAAQGYISLSWSDPSQLPLGEYVCQVTGSDSRGHIVQVTSSLEVSDVEPSIYDVIHYLKHQNEIMSHKNEDLKHQNDVLKNQVDDQQNRITDLEQCTKPHAGFTATLQATGSISLAYRSKVKFDNVLTNVGSAYDPTSGNFTCPSSGIYSFYTRLLASGGHQACFQLQHNGIAISSAHNHNENWYSTSTSAVVNCQQGDVVSVAVCASTVVYQTDASTWSHHANLFTGHLVEASHCFT